MSAPSRAVLVLHGYAQSAYIFSRRLGALRKECAKAGIELVFIDAPHILQPVDLFGDADLSAQEATTESPDADPNLFARGWWWAFRDRSKALGLDESLAKLRDVLKDRHFEGVLGFSQGAALAALLSAILEHPEAYPPFLVDGKPPHPPFKFCVSVAGFKPHDPLCDEIFGDSYSTPTLHVLGRTDTVVTEERSRTLLEVSTNKRVEWHDSGHFVPSKTPWRKFLVDYLKNPSGDIPSPGSVPASGTATPVSASGTATPANEIADPGLL